MCAKRERHPLTCVCNKYLYCAGKNYCCADQARLDQLAMNQRGLEKGNSWKKREICGHFAWCPTRRIWDRSRSRGRIFTRTVQLWGGNVPRGTGLVLNDVALIYSPQFCVGSTLSLVNVRMCL